MKDAKGHGSNPRGAHATGVEQVGKASDMLNTWGAHPILWDSKEYAKVSTSPEFGSVIAKLPQVQGTFYRGIPETDMSKYKPGANLVLDRHTSVASEPSSAATFATNSPSFVKGTPVLMRIENGRAADFGSTGRSTVGMGRDLILPMGTKLHIASVEPQSFGKSKGFLVKARQR